MQKDYKAPQVVEYGHVRDIILPPFTINSLIGPTTAGN